MTPGALPPAGVQSPVAFTEVRRGAGNGRARSAGPAVFFRGWSLLLSASALLLAGCAQTPAAVELLKLGWQGVPDPTAATAQGQGLRPELSYLRVQLNDAAPALMVLGYVDAQPAGLPLQSWYSGRQQLLQLAGGRVAATAGLPLDWRWVRGLPSTAPGEQPAGRYQRAIELRGAQAQTRLEDVEWAEVPASAVPRAVLPRGPNAARAAGWRWYRETATALQGCCTATPPAWFAVDPARAGAGPVYSFQCLAADRCLRIEPWPLARVEPR